MSSLEITLKFISFPFSVLAFTDNSEFGVRLSIPKISTVSFPVRLKDIEAPELGEEGGIESAQWLKERILGTEVDIIIDNTNRVGKFGRLIGDVISMGESMSEASLRENKSKNFGSIEEGSIPTLEDFL